MKATKNILITLLFILLTVKAVSASVNHKEPIKITVVPFSNNTGEHELDWISYGLLHAMTTNLGNLNGFITPVIVDWMALSDLKLPSLGDLPGMSYAGQAEYLRKELHTQLLCSGSYSGNSEKIKVEIILLNTGNTQIIQKLQFEASLQNLSAETSKAVLEIAEILGVSVNEEEKGRILTEKDKSMEAWRLHSTGYEQLARVLSKEGRKENGGEKKLLKSAEDALNAALTIDPDYAEAWNDLGYRYSLSFNSPEETEMASSAWNRSLKIKGYLSEAQSGLLLYLIETKNYNNAFNYAITVAESDSACHLSQIIMYRERIFNKVELTEETQKTARDAVTSHSDCRKLIGALFLSEKKDVTGVPILLTLMKSTNEDIRISAVSEIIRTGQEAGFIAMAEMLKDSRTLVKNSSSEMIEGIRNKPAVPYLIEAMTKYDMDQNIRMDLIKKIIKLGSKKDVPALTGLMEMSDRKVRLYAAVILVLMGNKIDEKAVMEILKSGDKEAKAIATELLGIIGTKTSVPLLMETLTDSDNNVSELAVWSLAGITNQTDSLPIVDKLISFLNNPDKQIRDKAVLALGLIKDKTAVPPLLNILHNQDEDETVRISVIHALAKLNDDSSIPILIELLKNTNAHIRLEAAGSLGSLRDKSAVPHLMETLKDTDPYVRMKAVESLGKIGDSSALKAIIALTETPAQGKGRFEINLYDTVTDALGKIGDPSSAQILIRLLKSPDKYLRYSVISSLGMIKDGHGVPGLVEALKDIEKVNRYRAAILLANYKEESAIPVLTEALNDKKYKYSQVNAAEALLKFGNKAGVPLLVEQLQTVDNEYEKRILDLLIKQGEKEVFYKRLGMSNDIVIFNIVRNNLIFVDSFDQLINSHDTFLRASGYYLSALRAREEGRYRDQIEFAEQAFKEVNPGQDTGIAILSLWLKAQAELKLNVRKDMIDTIRQTEGLLEYLSRKDIEDFNEPFAEYTLFLKGEIFTVSGDAKSAINVYESILENIKDKHRLKTIYYKSGVRDSAQRLEAMVRTNLGALQLKTGKENLEKAVDIGRNYQAADRLEMENEEKRYLELAKQRVAEGDYEESQKLIEELNLRRTQYINRRLKLNLSDPDKKNQVDEYTRRQDELDALSRRIQEVADKKGGRGGLDMMTPDPKTEQELSELQDERDRKRRDLQLYLTKLKKTHPDVVMLLGTKPIELATLQEQLPPNTAVLQYLILSDKLIVFVIKNDGIDIIEKQVQSTDIRAKVAAFREEIRAITVGKRSAGIRHLSQELYEILLKPVEDRGNLKGIKFLGIVPNSFLHYIPFGILMEEEGEQKRYLMERYDLFYINSTSMLWVALDRAKQKREVQPAIIAFSNPDSSLRYADIEVDNITGLFGEKKIYRHEEAKKEIMKNTRPDNSVLHLSTHAVFNPADSTKSFLLMADGNLTIEDIWGLPLKGTTLTTLSACETGIGEILSGDDVVSLENAFIFAGSPAVISTLWQVEDKSTAELMQVFYENLLKGKTKAEALTEAQRQIKERYKNPFYWAAFTLRGDWR